MAITGITETPRTAIEPRVEPVPDRVAEWCPGGFDWLRIGPGIETLRMTALGTPSGDGRSR